MTDRYKFWRDSLEGKNPPASPDDPKCGFYRMKRGTQKVPVAVWPLGESAGMSCLGFKIGHEVVGADIGTERWHWYAADPVTEAEYRKVAEQGLPWSDEDPTVAAITNGATKPAKNATQAVPDATKPAVDATADQHVRGTRLQADDRGDR